MTAPIMSTFNVEIHIDGAAFEDSAEVSRILRDLADRVEVQVIEEQVTTNGASGLTEGSWSVRDINGNTVGSAWVEQGES